MPGLGSNISYKHAVKKLNQTQNLHPNSLQDASKTLYSYLALAQTNPFRDLRKDPCVFGGSDEYEGIAEAVVLPRSAGWPLGQKSNILVPSILKTPYSSTLVLCQEM